MQTALIIVSLLAYLQAGALTLIIWAKRAPATIANDGFERLIRVAIWPPFLIYYLIESLSKLGRP